MDMQQVMQLANKFKCPKCDNIGANVDQLSGNGVGIGNYSKHYSSLSCKKCGYTELYKMSQIVSDEILAKILAK